MTRFSGSVFVTAALLTAACGRSGATTPTGDGGSAGSTVTITSSGASPRNITVGAGSQVTFVNNDARSHSMNSDPHPEHTDCPEINQAGFLNAGQRRQTGNLNLVRSCGFHDHDDPLNTSLQGTITIR